MLGCSISRFSRGELSSWMEETEEKHSGGVKNHESSRLLGYRVGRFADRKLFSSCSLMEPKCDKIFLKGTSCKFLGVFSILFESSMVSFSTSSHSLSSSSRIAVTFPSKSSEVRVWSFSPLKSLVSSTQFESLVFPNKELKRELNILHERGLVSTIRTVCCGSCFSLFLYIFSDNYCTSFSSAFIRCANWTQALKINKVERENDEQTVTRGRERGLCNRVVLAGLINPRQEDVIQSTLATRSKGETQIKLQLNW